MAGRGSQTFKKRQKEQQRKEKQEEKRSKRFQRKNEPPRSADDLDVLEGPAERPLEESGEDSVIERDPFGIPAP